MEQALTGSADPLLTSIIHQSALCCIINMLNNI